MAFWFYKGLRRGVVTTRYPRGPLDPWTTALPTPPAFRPELLSGALALRLVAECSSGALTVEGDELVVDLGRCTGCGRCLELGGDAVVPSGEFLLAGRDRAAYLKRVPILLEVSGDD
jgi:hypothetical protein